VSVSAPNASSARSSSTAAVRQIRALFRIAVLVQEVGALLPQLQ